MTACGVCLIFVDRLIGRNGTAGIAASTTAAGSATVLAAASVIVSSLLVPPLTAGGARVWFSAMQMSLYKLYDRRLTNASAVDPGRRPFWSC